MQDKDIPKHSKQRSGYWKHKWGTDVGSTRE